MAAPIRPPRARSSGGRTLMLLGVLLALAAGAIVIYIVSSVTTRPTDTIQVVVAAQDLPSTTILSVTDGSKGHVLITQAFKVEDLPTNVAPANALVFDSQDKLNILMNNKVVVQQIYAGEVLRGPSDPRLVDLGSSTPGSLVNINPGAIQPGQVLTSFTIADQGQGGKPPVVPGDRIDLLVTECNLGQSAKDVSGCETQTTIQNILIYAVTGNSVWVVMSRQDALFLKYLKETGKTDIVIRKPGDTDTPKTVAVDAASVVSQFHYDR